METDELIVQGRMSQGFGIVPKMIMRDQRLTIQAKAIYAYFCSYAGAGTSVFPSVSKIVYDLKISKDTYTKHLKLLKDNGYIKVKQQRNNKGVYSKNIYTLCEIIEVNQESEGEEKAEEEQGEKTSQPYPNLPHTDLPCPVLTASAQTDTNNNSIYNNNSNINNRHTDRQSDSQSDTKKVSSPISDNLVKPTTNNFIYDYNTCLETLQENINYKSYRQAVEYNLQAGDYEKAERAKQKLQIVDDMVSIMLDTILSKGDIKIGDEVKPRELVSSVFLKLTQEHIEYSYGAFSDTRSVVKNKTGYIRSILYASYHEMNADIQNFAQTYVARG